MRKLLAILFSLSLIASLLGGCKAKETSENGRVYYLNFKPEQDEAWQNVAKKYTEETGIPVEIVTASQGSYEETLTAEIDKEKAPTLFQLSGETGLDAWQNYCLDLSDTEVYRQLSDDDFALKRDGKVYGIGYVYEGYGLIVNQKLLRQAGYEMADITSFDTLKSVAEDIHSRAAELGFDAFTSSTLDSASSWRFSGHLANIPLFYEFEENKITSQPASIQGKYLDSFKKLWDLYTQNATIEPAKITTTIDAAKEFTSEKAVFYQNGTWAYEDVKSVGDENLGLLPIYAGIDDESQGVCCGTENYWAVNAKASEIDRKATLDFLAWMVTSETGTTALAEQMGFVAPFKKAKEVDNVLANQMNAYIEKGDYTNIAWSFQMTPNVSAWRDELVSALAAYTTGKGSWDAVKTAFIDGWARQYQAAHS